MAKSRKLASGGEVPGLDNVVELTVHTKAPEKWVLIDMENGRMYQGSYRGIGYGKWIWINRPEIEENNED
jgi:6-phosphofructokinase